MIRTTYILLLILVLTGCTQQKKEVIVLGEEQQTTEEAVKEEEKAVPDITPDDINIIKDLKYDQYTLKDRYEYKDTVRSFKWDVIKKHLAFIENMQKEKKKWVVLQNYKNRNKEAPLVRNYIRNVYKRIADTLEVERYQSVPLYMLNDTLVPEIYGRDGSLAYITGQKGTFMRIKPMTDSKEWYAPKQYLKILPEKISFNYAIVVGRRDQNITTLERTAPGEWRVRSMNPATTGQHRPPYAQETPLGSYIIQEKKEKMVFLKDGSKENGGFAPYASRFTNGAYIHGVPVNLPATKMIEYSWSLGTTPRSHMCVRNATSHAKFIYDYMPALQTIVIVID